jgi:hypothetical protein
MSGDIVERLRFRGEYIAGECSRSEEENRDLMVYAADEIERLRALLVLDLPDAEHIHLHRQPDGTITAVPMDQIGCPDCKGRDEWVDTKDQP